MIVKILLSIIFLLVFYNTLRNKPMITELIITKEVNLGNVNLNSKREFEISLTNLTRKDFKIAKAYTSCGCTKVIGEASFNVNQGETVNVKVEFDPGSMHKKGDSIDHEVYFLVTNPVEKEYKVKITGRVI